MPVGSKAIARTLWVPTSMATIVGPAPAHRRAPSCEQDARRHQAVRVERARAAPRMAAIPSGPFSAARYGAWSRPIAVLVADRPAVRDDHLARRPLEPAPALERLVRVGGEPEDVGRVQARPARVDVRQVAEGVDPLVDGRRGRGAGSARAPRPGPGMRRPVGGGLERVHGVARRPTACCAGTAPRTARVARRGRPPGAPTPPLRRGRSARPRRPPRATDGPWRPSAPTITRHRLRSRPAQGRGSGGASAGRRRVAGQRERRRGLERRRDADHRQRQPRLGERRGPASSARSQSGDDERVERARAAGPAVARTTTSVRIPTRPSEPRTSWRRSGPAAEAGIGRQVQRPGRRLDVAAGEQRLDAAVARPTAGRPIGSTTQPPTVEYSNDCG